VTSPNSGAAGFSYLRQVDAQALAATAPEVRYSQKLIDRDSGADVAAVGYIRTPPGGGSPRGLHTHEWEQIFYILEGTMAIEVEGHRFDATPGSLVVFPQGVPHRNWNDTDQPTVHLAFNAPLPAAGDERDQHDRHQ
jgi:quercetin dioxygenase-like cupin family protein